MLASGPMTVTAAQLVGRAAEMRTLDGLALCERIVGARPDLPVIVVTGHASVDAAIGALRAGAFDFIQKPVEPEILALVIRAQRDENPRRRHGGNLCESVQERLVSVVPVGG